MSLAQLQSLENVSTHRQGPLAGKRNDAESREQVQRVSSLAIDQSPNSEPNIGAPVVVTEAVRSAFVSFLAYGCF